MAAMPLWYYEVLLLVHFQAPRNRPTSTPFQLKSCWYKNNINGTSWSLKLRTFKLLLRSHLLNAHLLLGDHNYSPDMGSFIVVNLN